MRIAGIPRISISTPRPWAVSNGEVVTSARRASSGSAATCSAIHRARSAGVRSPTVLRSTTIGRFQSSSVASPVAGGASTVCAKRGRAEQAAEQQEGGGERADAGRHEFSNKNAPVYASRPYAGGMARPLDLAGCVAVVTGASSGIGAALARALVKRGAAVALVARRTDRLRALADEIEAGGGRASVHPGDVAERDGVERSADEIRARYGRVDGLVNNAGFVHHGLVKDQPPENIERLVATNLLGTLHWTQALLPALCATGAGWIVNVSSFAALVPQPDEAVYSATKAGVSAFGAALGHELEPRGVHVLTVHPVLVRTEMFTPEVMERMPKGSEQRFVSAEAFAEETLAALARGERSAVVPRAYRWVLRLRALAPRRFDRFVARSRLAALPDFES